MTKSLDHCLEPYPHLRKALGETWVTEQNQIDPIQSSFPLARWLRMDGFEPDLITLDAVLGRLSGIAGIASRRKRIRTDAPGFMETLTELYFGAWLANQRCYFEWPKQGPDFLVPVEGNGTLLIEVTTPRKSAWSQDLFERLHLVALQTGYSAHLEFSLEELHGSCLSSEVVAIVVERALEGLASVEHRPREVKQCYSTYGLEITWNPSETPDIRAVYSPGATTPYSGFQSLVSAAQSKARQLPEEQPAVLALGMNQMPTSWWSFIDSLRFPRPGPIHFDWSRLPNQVKYIILYSMEGRRIEPFDAIWITNPASNLPHSPYASRFFQDLFPFPLRTAHDSDFASQ